VHDAGELAARFPELVLRLASQARVRRGAVHDEGAPDRRSPELLANLSAIALSGVHDGEAGLERRT